MKRFCRFVGRIEIDYILVTRDLIVDVKIFRAKFPGRRTCEIRCDLRGKRERRREKTSPPSFYRSPALRDVCLCYVGVLIVVIIIEIRILGRENFLLFVCF
ncbi:hypothetical protein ACS0PU_000091 [Formica fusca]